MAGKKILKCNVNHLGAAQNLLIHTAIEEDAALLAVAELYASLKPE